jgi:predicted membrane channel-forming protein YqfA (hemolysin III family)
MDSAVAAAYFRAMTYRTRKRLAILFLLLGLPLYLVAALWILSLFDRPPFLLELAVYVALGVVWAFPLKRLFRGLGRPDPDSGGAG